MIHRTLGLAVAGMIFTGVAGCASPSAELQTRQEIKTATVSQYPGSARQSDTFKVTAIDNASAGTIDLINPTDTAVPAKAKVWVNGLFVKEIDAIPARGITTVKYAELLESGGGGVSDLNRAKQAVAKVELQTDQGLFTVAGPAKR